MAAGAGAGVLVPRAVPVARPSPLLAETHTKDLVAQPPETQGPLPSVRTGPYRREGPAGGATPAPAAPGSGPVLGRGPGPAARARASASSVTRGAPPFFTNPPDPCTDLNIPKSGITLSFSSDRVHPAQCVPTGLCPLSRPILAAAGPSDLALFAGYEPS